MTRTKFSFLFVLLSIFSALVFLEDTKQAKAGPAKVINTSLPPLRIAFIPSANPGQMLEDVRPVITYLEKELGRPVRPYVMTDYSAAVEALRGGQADVSFMSPLPYVMAHHMGVADALLGEIYRGHTTYRAKIFVRRDSKIRRLADLRGKTISFVDPISSSGFMYPVDIFHRAGLLQPGEGPEKFFGRTYFAGGDEQAIRSVFNRFTDAAGIGEFSISLLRPEEREMMVSIAESVDIPSHCVVVRRGLNPELRKNFRNATLNLNKPTNRHLLRFLYGIDGYVTVTHKSFLGVEQLAIKHGFLQGK